MVQVGYYPGQGMSRPPKGGKAKPVKPREYDFDYVEKWLQQTYKEVDFSRVPAAIWNDIVSDVQRQLSVAATPNELGYDPQVGLEYGDIDQTPGVAVKININPKDWIDDPKKQIDKTAKDLKKAIFNWDDIRNYVEKKYFWEPVIGGHDNLAPAGSRNISPVAGVVEDDLGMGVPGEMNPFQLTGIGVEMPEKSKSGARLVFDIDGKPIKVLIKDDKNVVTGSKEVLAGPDLLPLLDPVTGAQLVDNLGKPLYKTSTDINKPVDVYERAGKSFLGFMDKVEASGSRNSAYVKFQFDAARAVEAELQTYIHSTVIDPNNFNPVLDKRTLVNPAISKSTVSAIEEYSNAVELGRQMGILRAGDDGRGGIGGLTKTLSKVAVIGGAEKKWDGKALVTVSIQDSLNGFKDKELKGAKDAVANVRKSLSGDPKKLAAFNSLISPFEANLKKAEEIVSKYVAMGSSIDGDREVARRLLNELSRVGGKGVSRDFFAGYEQKYLENLINKAVMKGLSPFDHQDDTLARVINEVMGARESNGERSGLANIRRVLAVSKSSYEKNDYGDFFRNVEDGTLIKKYVWPRLRARVENSLPAAMLKSKLQENYYFGLLYNEDWLELNVKKSGALEKNTKFYLRTGIIKAEWDPKARMLPKNVFSVNIDGVGKVKFQGGQHFSGVKNLHNVLTTPTAEDKARGITTGLNAIINKKTGAITGFSDGGTQFIRFLNGNLSGKLPGPLSSGGYLDLMGATDPKKWMRQNNRFLAYLRVNKDQLKLTFKNGRLVESEENAKIIASLLTKLHKREGSTDYISILAERATYLQKFSSLVNQVQSKILKITGRFIAPYVQLKNWITSKLSVLLAGVVTDTLSYLTGGLLAAIKPFVDKVLGKIFQFVIQFVLYETEAFVKAVLKGDMSAFIKGIDKLVNNTVKIVMYIVGIPAVLVLLIALPFMGATLSTISPIDPTEVGGYVIGDQSIVEEDIDDDDGDGSFDDDGFEPPVYEPTWCMYGNWELNALDQSPRAVGKVARALAVGLCEGFWGYYNFHPNYDAPNYPDLWDERRFKFQPNPPTEPPYGSYGNIHDCWNCMFWCTYLVRYSNQEAGYSVDQLPAGANNMALYMQDSPDWDYNRNEGDSEDPVDVRPGDTIFFRYPGWETISHVAIVHNVDIYDEYGSGEITTVHSNSGLKVIRFQMMDGIVIGAQGLEVEGFGRHVEI